MATGGIFTLISNDGKQDNLIMRTGFLMNRLRDLACNKLKILKQRSPHLSNKDLIRMDADWQPTLAEIETTHTLFINSTFKPFVTIAHEYVNTTAKGGAPKLGSTVNFTLPVVGDFVNDPVLHITLSGLQAVSSLDKVRYCEYLGHRLMQNVSLKVSGQEIDRYNTDDYNIYYQYKVPVGKDEGYLRNIGQEIPYTGYLTADPTVDEVRQYLQFGNGPQTFKQSQGTVEMWIPLLFWFRDIQCSLPNFILPINQTLIEVTLAQQQSLVAYANYGGGGAYTPPTITTCELYTNQIFMLPEITKIFQTRYGMQLIRVHRVASQRITKSSDSLDLHELKWPIENIYVGFRPVINTTNSQNWYKNAYLTSVSVPLAVVTGVATIQVNSAVFYAEQQVIQTMNLTASDITIYPTLSSSFYNNYIPYRWGPNIKTPGVGWLMMNFNVNPGDQNPSGHINVSRTRELYLNYVSALLANGTSIISNSNPVDFLLVADAINFILYMNNNMTLKYST